jgi:hypothetical protein
MFLLRHSVLPLPSFSIAEADEPLNDTSLPRCTLLEEDPANTPTGQARYQKPMLAQMNEQGSSYSTNNRLNRRTSNSLSPVLIHFVAPHGKLLHRLLVLEQLLGSIPPLLPSQQHAGPREPHYGIPPEAWPNVIRRVMEDHESLRRVAAD